MRFCLSLPGGNSGSPLGTVLTGTGKSGEGPLSRAVAPIGGINLLTGAGSKITDPLGLFPGPQKTADPIIPPPPPPPPNPPILADARVQASGAATRAAAAAAAGAGDIRTSPQGDLGTTGRAGKKLLGGES